MGTEEFCLKWDNHNINLMTGFDQFLSKEVLVDVTIACEGLSLKAHKIVLSACSPFFQTLFLENPCMHPIIIMKDVKYAEMKALLDFIYKGEINVSQQQLTQILKTAEVLNIKGLVDIANRINEGEIVLEEIAESKMATSFFTVSMEPPSSSLLNRKKRSRRKRTSSCTDSDNTSVPLKIQETEIAEDSKSSSSNAPDNQSESNQSQQISLSDTSPSTKRSDGLPETNILCHDNNCIDNSQLIEISESGRHQIQTEACISKEDKIIDNSESMPCSSKFQSDKEQDNSENDDELDDSQEDEDDKKKRTYECSKCEKQFKNSSTLRRHERIHSGVKLFSCDICKQGFNQRSYLKTHMMTHTGEKPYKCDACDQRFIQKSNLNQHSLIHSGDKPFICDICKQAFNRMETLRKHTRTHTGEKPYQCEICKEGFSRKEGLKKHFLLHTGEKPFSCHICKHRFTQPYNLYSHLKTHSDEKPFVCTACNKRFARNYNLKQHTKLHKKTSTKQT